ncbi:MAG TPA: tripartite tricarboxylate transporter substrate binding protein [Ramlibacter sp.]|nr:tripartite tricarboxylate transporter substrate binding protein [Ramlibacter sp.]
MKARPLTRLLVLLLSAHVSCIAAAQTMPDGKPVRIVVPFSAGGQQDAIARYLATGLTSQLGTPVVVENKAGASGMIAAESVAKGPADGSNLLLTTGAAISIAPHFYPKLSYNPAKDFVSVAMIADIPMSLAVRANSPYKSLADVVADARTRPEKVSVANTGIGSISHLTGELFSQALGIKLLHVPYKGVGSIQDLIGGQVDLIMTSAVSLDSLVASQKVRVLGTFTKERVPTSGGAPTVSEALGLKGLEFPVWVAVLAPAKTPPKQLERISAELLAICKTASTTEAFKGITACADAKTLDRVVLEDRQRWGEIIRKANIKPE